MSNNNTTTILTLAVIALIIGVLLYYFGFNRTTDHTVPTNETTIIDQDEDNTSLEDSEDAGENDTPTTPSATIGTSPTATPTGSLQ